MVQLRRSKVSFEMSLHRQYANYMFEKIAKIKEPQWFRTLKEDLQDLLDKLRNISSRLTESITYELTMLIL